MPTIDDILASRSAFLKGSPGDREAAHGRCELTMEIEHNYPAFERLRDALLDARRVREAQTSGFLHKRRGTDEDEWRLFDMMLQHGILQHDADQFVLSDVSARRFVTGGWLEELAWLAAVEAGADEAYYSQMIGWEVSGYAGENEVDVIFRRDDRLGFVSCKALRSTLTSADRKHRARMMDAVHEADNLADHFGKPGERVGVLVTTDLFDDKDGAPRYEALMGKAAVLDVRIIPLEDLAWPQLVGVMRHLMEG
jgi:hypothetical protein